MWHHTPMAYYFYLLHLTRFTTKPVPLQALRNIAFPSFNLLSWPIKLASSALANQTDGLSFNNFLLANLNSGGENALPCFKTFLKGKQRQTFLYFHCTRSSIEMFLSI